MNTDNSLNELKFIWRDVWHQSLSFIHHFIYIVQETHFPSAWILWRRWAWFYKWLDFVLPDSCSICTTCWGGTPAQGARWGININGTNVCCIWGLLCLGKLWQRLGGKKGCKKLRPLVVPWLDSRMTICWRRREGWRFWLSKGFFWVGLSHSGFNLLHQLQFQQLIWRLCRLPSRINAWRLSNDC